MTTYSSIKLEFDKYGEYLPVLATVQELRFRPTGDLQQGDMIKTSGNLVFNDGIGADWVWDPNSQAVDDGNSVIAPLNTPTGRWLKAVLSQGVVENQLGTATNLAPSQAAVNSALDTKAPNAFTHSAPGLIGSLQRKLQKVVDVSDAPYLSVSGGPDMTVPIQQALNSGAGEIIVTGLRTGERFHLSDALVCQSQVLIHGQNRWGTGFLQTKNDTPIFVIDNKANVDIRDMTLDYTTTPVAGARAILCTGSQTCNFRNLWFASSWDSIAVVGGGNHEISNIRSYNYGNAAIHLEDTIDNHVSTVNLFAINNVNGRSGGIVLLGGCEGNGISLFHAKLGLYGLRTDIKGSGGRGYAPFQNTFSQCLFDSQKEAGASLVGSQHMDFNSCWFASAGHDEAVGFSSAIDRPGISISKCQHISFVGGRSYNNGGRGAIVYPDSKYISFSGGMTFMRNQYTRSANGAAIEILGGTTDWSVIGCQFERDSDTTKYRQLNAVLVNAGASDRYHFALSQLGGCAAFDGGTGTNKTWMLGCF